MRPDESADRARHAEGVAKAIAALRLGESLGIADAGGIVWVTALDDLTIGVRAEDSADYARDGMICTPQRAAWLSGSAPQALSQHSNYTAALWTREAGWRGSSRPAHYVGLALLKRAALLPMAWVGTQPRERGFQEIFEANDLQQALAEKSRLRLVAQAPVPLMVDEAAVIRAFRPDDGGREHLLITVGNPEPGKPPLLRMHSECFTGDLLGSLRCDCGGQLRGGMARLAEGGGGYLAYLAQEGRGIGLVNKLRAYELQDRGLDTVDANLCLGYLADERDFEPAAAMLRSVGVNAVRLLSNNPAKVSALRACGITVTERLSLKMDSNPYNQRYLDAKAARFGHDLD